MQKLISNSTSFYGAGNSLARRSFVVKSGPYSGRKVVVYPGDTSTFEFRYSDPPYNDWSDQIQIAADAADFPGSGWIDDEGNIYFVYSQQSTLNLLFRKLTPNLGSWVVGDAITIFAGGNCYFPSISRDSLQRLHVTFTWYDSGSGNYRIRYKRSTVDGAVWGGGSSDPGTDLTTGSASAYSQLQYLPPYTYCIYTAASTRLATRKLIDGGLSWDAELIAHNGLLLSDRFCAAVSESASLLGVAFESVNKLHYLESDGNTWSGLYELAIGPATPPLLQFSGANALVFFGVSKGTGQTAIVYRRKQGTGFKAEEAIGGEAVPFLDVLLFDDDGSPNYVSRRDQAADSAAADVSHFTSGALVADSGDAIYFGADQPFASLTCILSTAGVGGEVIWEYFSGSTWQEFTPLSGAYSFDQLSQVLRLWSESASAPDDWQFSQVNSTTARWLRARVVTPYSTPPVGSQFTPLVDIKYLSA